MDWKGQYRSKPKDEEQVLNQLTLIQNRAPTFHKKCQIKSKAIFSTRFNQSLSDITDLFLCPPPPHTHTLSNSQKAGRTVCNSPGNIGRGIRAVSVRNANLSAVTGVCSGACKEETTKCLHDVCWLSQSLRVCVWGGGGGGGERGYYNLIRSKYATSHE